ncbi:hypothetical protein GW17_00011052 [Ensete ventricosum]|nr:hypothetical protein GW17_00011052 [Ensete ventricosum]RZS28643.1 hypothetical protein BHM03_00062280 [Ensete ventricosum]
MLDCQIRTQWIWYELKSERERERKKGDHLGGRHETKEEKRKARGRGKRRLPAGRRLADAETMRPLLGSRLVL